MDAIVRKNDDMINDIDQLQRVAKMYAVSSLFSAKGNNDQAIAHIAVQIMAGREMGMGPFTSVQSIHIIQGRPALAANAMAAAVKAHPRYNYTVRKMAEDEVILEFFENGKTIGTSSFTADDAVKAGTKNTDKYPRNMLFARAMSNGVKWYCPDVFNGNAVYVPEELGEVVDGDNLSYITVEDAPEINPTEDATDEPDAPDYTWPKNAEILELCTGSIHSVDIPEDVFTLLSDFHRRHADSSAPMNNEVKRGKKVSEYGFSVWKLEERYGKDCHNALWSALTGSIIAGDNLPGVDCRIINDWLLKPASHADKISALDLLVQTLQSELDNINVE